MTPQQRQEIAHHLAAFDFSELFTSSSLGWDWPAGRGRLRVPHGSSFLELDIVAEKRGVKILHCPPDSSGRIPLSEDRRKIEKAVTPLASEHLLIFTDAANTRQIWQWPAKQPGKPSSLRELTWEKGKSNELLFQKLASIAFTLDEEEGLDITGVVRRLADTLDRDKVTKRFYDLFKKQKDAFQKFIKGLSDSGLQAWYTSLMLNRIMFCYFLQRKGFLDGDQNYLANRLARVQDQIGKNKFHSFYRSFLRRLFHEGLGSQDRSQELIALIGTIPYLNGGIFDEHPIERGHPNLSIPDEAFEKVFKFFDQFDWHLDDRPIADGNEINPEILGYVFEKYTNQKEMGAYYTKEDITEYISKNCIIPFLVQAVAEKLHESTWQMIQTNPDRYIYAAVRRGAGHSAKEWESSLPANISRGLDATKPRLIERRKDWNTTTPSPFNLPTEIWRETIARHQRCHELREKLRSGAVTSIDDFVSFNLDIRQFAQDVIESADASFLLAFFERLKKLSVLDPTCGSGAFLFAALEILEPLYTACIQRFRAILADWQSCGAKHSNWEKEIKAILDHAAAHPNESYYIHKTIIVHNLYGVDIMEEAVEICKLRLFLKLAAQLEPGQQVEPLPDIDFNIRSGNSLVGYVSRDQVRRAFTDHQGGGKNSQLLLGGIEHSLDDYRRIEEQAEDADRAFQRFHQLQESARMDAAVFRQAKERLQSTLEVMRNQLNRFLAGDYDKKHLKVESAIQTWIATHQPFHWFIEFYGIMKRGGFDVIVGNPPFVEFTPAKVKYTLQEFDTLPCGNLYAFVSERSANMTGTTGRLGLIMPSASICTPRMSSLMTAFTERFSESWISLWDERPSKLFDGVDQQLSIHLHANRGSSELIHITAMRHWASAERFAIFSDLKFTQIEPSSRFAGAMPKIGTEIERTIMASLASKKTVPIESLQTRVGEAKLYYRNAGGRYWRLVKTFPTHFRAERGQTSSSTEKTVKVQSDSVNVLAACLSSTLFYWFWRVSSNCRHLTDRELSAFPIPKSILHGSAKEEAERLGRNYEARLKQTKHRLTTQNRQSGQVVQDVYRVSAAKPIVDEIDTLLSEHYDLSDEQLDFIINYDIKYRLGLGREGADEDADEED